MIRLFSVYYPVRTLILLIGDALIVATSLVVGAMYANWEDSYVVLVYNHGYLEIIAVTFLVLVQCYWFDLYDTSRVLTKGELFFRLLIVPGLTAFLLAGVSCFRPDFVPGNGSVGIVGLLILTVAMLGWRIGFTWVIRLPILTERIYVLGTGAQAQRLVQGLRQNPEIGVEVASWTGKMECAITRESVAEHLIEVVHEQKVHRVILAMPDRDTIPKQQLFDLRMQGVKVEEATSWVEKISNRIEVANLDPGWLARGDGFRRSTAFMFTRRVLSVVVSLVGLILAMPLFPLIMLAVRIDSAGPVFYIQTRVGKNGRLFKVVKFRTMRRDAEAANGPQWAVENDPRVTRFGKFLRSLRLDDIPQLWCVLKGDMAIVGPRPERPEFVEWLSKEIPFYGTRNTVRPGVTGWAQIKYRHVSTVEDAREELQYDLFYVKNASIGLDLLIMFMTIKTVLLGRGA